MRCVHSTCVTHVIVVGRALVCGDTTGIADSSRILAHFGLRHWCSVSAKISGFHGWRGLLKKMGAEDIKNIDEQKRVCVLKYLEKSV